MITWDGHSYTTSKGNKVDINQPMWTVLDPKEVVKAGYDGFDKLAKIFNHNMVASSEGVWRWETNRFIDYIQDFAPVLVPSYKEIAADYPDVMHRPAVTRGQQYHGSLDLNHLCCQVNVHFSMEEWMKFYMQIGYSLGGFCEVFGQHEASEYKLPGAKKAPEGWREKHDDYYETVIEYMLRVHKGKVLKL